MTISPITLEGAARRADDRGVYRCFHCHDLHVTADQARVCATTDTDWFAAALGEVDRILRRGPIPCDAKREMRDEREWTMAERRLRNALDAALPGEVRSHWWVPGSDYLVGLFIPSVSLALEVDDGSQGERVGADRLRSSVLRSHGVVIARIPESLAMTAADAIAATVVGWVGAGDVGSGASASA